MNGKKTKSPDMRRLGISAAGGIIMAVSLCGTSAWVVERGWLSREMMDPVAVGILAVSGFFGAVICGRGGGILVQALSGLGILLTLLGFNLALFGGELHGVIPCLAALAGGVGVGVLAGGIGRKKTGHYYRPKGKYR